ncbi:MAG: heme NO-binding domain-containing protein [Candidatus Saccharibacteria bacterium]|nr:heme NO-binding domain-containing protein [Pseudorhodobacter sp.]
MHGLINRSIQCFIEDTCSDELWDNVVRSAGLKISSFEAMLTYDDSLTDLVVDAALRVLGRTRAHLFEDLGQYLVSHDSLTSVRRLLRFSGVNFVDFLNSLEDLPERGHLALPDLDLPDLELLDQGGGKFVLRCKAPLKGTGFILVGLLRAMADDYGALVTLDHLGEQHGAEIISILIVEQALYAARPFHLGAEMS